MKFKDYEYGWYGLNCSCKAKWFDLGYSQFYTTSRKSGENQTMSIYDIAWRTNEKQLPKLKDVIFIYGGYQDVI